MARRRFKKTLSGIINIRSDGQHIYCTRRVRASYQWELYGPIEMMNPKTHDVVASFLSAAGELAEITNSGNQQDFNRMFEQVRSIFGPFTEEALERSSFLIDRLVERS